MKNKQKQFLRNYFSLVHKQLGWIQGFLNPGIALRDFDPLLASIQRVFMTRGKDAGIAYVKAMRGNYLNYLSGNPERFPGVRLTNSGLPLAFGPLLKHFSGSGPRAEMLRFLNTVLFCTRGLKTQAEFKYETIVAPSKRGKSYPSIHIWAAEFWRILGYRELKSIPRSLKWNRFHFTSKNGPHGHALASWIDDLIELPKQLFDSIILLGGVKLESFLRTALDQISLVLPMRLPFKQLSGGAPLRRIAFFADKEGKSRVIAILDYFSQTVLKGLHSYLFRALKKIPQDMTFDQGAFVDRIKDWEIYYSVDLSAATDRFPISLISNVLRGHLPDSYVDAWEHVMVGYPFKVPIGIDDTPDNRNNPSILDWSENSARAIKYAVGNPMGAYSSWASFAFAHHYIFFALAKLLGRDWKSLPYVVLGDDVLIGDTELGELYLQVIEDLGVDVSLAKTHKSKTTCEFAKRWIHKGQEISPFPLSAMKSVGKKYYLLTGLLLELEKKGFQFPMGIDQVVLDFYHKVYPRRSRWAKSLASKSYVVEQIIRIIWGGQAATHINNICGHLRIPLKVVSDRQATRWLADVAETLFRQSNPANTEVGKGKPLGLIAENLVMYLTGLLEEHPEAMTLLENPVLHAYGSIEQRYLDLLKLTKNSENVGSLGQWPLLVRAMTIPLSDELFIDRKSQTEALGASRIGKMLEARLREEVIEDEDDLVFIAF